MSDEPDSLVKAAELVTRLRKQLVRARQVSPGAGSSEREIALLVAGGIEASLADALREYDEEFARVYG